jgi:alpha-L-arabinofuranosidase
MIAQSYQPRVLDVELSNPNPQLDVTAVKSEDGKTLVLRVANSGTDARTCAIHLEGFNPTKAEAIGEELAASLDAVNTAAEPGRVTPRPIQWKHGLQGQGSTKYTFPASSFTVLRIE